MSRGFGDYARNRSLAAAAVLLAGVPAAAQRIETQAYSTESAVYRCAGGATLPVLYLELKQGESFATVYFRGKLTLLRAIRTGPNAFYASVDEAAGLRWRVQGGAGALSFLAADHTAKESALLTECRATNT